MIVRIAVHEARSLVRERVVLVAWLLFLVTTVAGLLTGTTFMRSFQVEAGAVEAAHDAHMTRMRAQLDAVAKGHKPDGVFVAARPASLRYRIVNPVSPLTVLSLGSVEVLPAAATVGVFTSEAAMFDLASLTNPDHLHIGRFDLGFVIVVLLPLLAIALSFNMVAGEREQGTLALLLAQPVPFVRLVAAKSVVVWLAVAVPAIVVPLVWTVVVHPEARLAGARLGTFAALVGAYAAFWVALSAAVNLARWRPATNALVLGGLWLILVLVVPAGLGAVAEWAYPAPSRMELIGEARVAEVEASQQRAQLVDRFYRDHPDMVPAATPGQPNRTLAAYAAALEVERAVDPVYDRFERQLTARDRVLAAAMLLSPSVALRQGLVQLAGTGRDRFAAFRRRALAMRAALRADLVPVVAAGGALTRADYDKARQSASSEEGAGLPAGAMAGTALPAGLLALWVAWRSRRVSGPTNA